MLDRGQKFLNDADIVSCLYYIEEVKNRGLNFHDILKCKREDSKKILKQTYLERIATPTQHHST